MSEKEIGKEKNREVKIEKGKGFSSKASLVIALRNKFFFMLYRYSSLVFISSIATLITSALVFSFFANQKVPAQYVLLNEDGTYIQLQPIKDCKSRTEAEVKKFVNTATNKLFRYDYINYADQLQDAAPYFTTDGWNAFLDSLKASGALAAAVENKWIVTNEILGPAEFTKEPYVDPVDGACTWEVKVPLVLTYIGASSLKDTVDFHIRLSRVSVIKSTDGLGIKRVIISSKGK